MSNPYLLSEPASISFSGGRTSGMMLYNVRRQGHFDFGDEDGIDCFCTD